jgi:hypothetical protein
MTPSIMPMRERTKGIVSVPAPTTGAEKVSMDGWVLLRGQRSRDRTGIDEVDDTTRS